jgi:hypothetical protein
MFFEGDSHHYAPTTRLKQGQGCIFEAGADTVACNSLPNSTTFHRRTPGIIIRAAPNHYDVENFHRVVVHGSTEPLEWLR